MFGTKLCKDSIRYIRSIGKRIYIYVYIPCDSKGLLIILCVYLLLRVCEHKLRHPYALHQSFDISCGRINKRGPSFNMSCGRIIKRGPSFNQGNNLTIKEEPSTNNNDDRTKNRKNGYVSSSCLPAFLLLSMCSC